MTKKQKQRQTQKGAARVASEAVALGVVRVQNGTKKTEAQELLRGISSSHKSFSKTSSTKRARLQIVSATAQTRAYNEEVQQKGRGRVLGPPFTHGWAGLIQGHRCRFTWKS